jgi:amidase
MKGPLPTTAGSLALKDNVTGRDAPLVARLRQAGAIIVGKTNLSEWANFRSSDSISGWSAVGGQTRNAHALDRNGCGSSTGSGVAVAAGLVPMAVGTETNGSITCPASISGIVGFKPTVGLVSRTHVIPISHSQDTPGPMTRTVREAAAMLTAMAGSDPADAATREADARKTDYVTALSDNSLRGRRIGVMRFATGFGTDAAFAEALETLRREGAILVDIDKFEGRGQIGSESYKVLLSEFKADLNAYLATTPPTVRTRTLADLIAFNSANASAEMPLFGQDIFEGSEKTKGLDDPEYKKARATSFRLAGPEGIDKLLKQHKVEALVGPTVAAAWLIDAVHGDQYPGGGAAASPLWPAIRTSPCRWARSKASRWASASWARMVRRADPVARLNDYEQASQSGSSRVSSDRWKDTPEVQRAFRRGSLGLLFPRLFFFRAPRTPASRRAAPQSRMTSGSS